MAVCNLPGWQDGVYELHCEGDGCEFVAGEGFKNGPVNGMVIGPAVASNEMGPKGILERKSTDVVGK